MILRADNLAGWLSALPAAHPDLITAIHECLLPSAAREAVETLSSH
jgi:hypothetical protein